MKHAFLIIAHNEFILLQRLIDAIDDERCDIFVHFDKKIKDIPNLETRRSKLYTYSEKSVYWGDYSMVQTEFSLLRKSISGEYDYYHLLSGVDMPIKPMDYIHDYFMANNGTIFIDSYKYPDGELEKKIQLWHIFPHKFTNQPGKYIGFKYLRAAFLRFQQIIGVKRNKDLEFRKGSQWFSIPFEAAKYLLSQENNANRIFTHTFCPDEVVIQTLLYNSPFKNAAFIDEWNGNGNKRFIDWSTGNVRTFTLDDIDKLMTSDSLFARKFSSSHIDIVNEISKRIK